MRVVAFIHAKGSSERVPCKNMRVLGSKPLFAHAIKTALGSEYINDVIIDSEDDEILELGERYGATPRKRPIELANNQTDGNQLAHYAASLYSDYDYLVQILPPAPFIKSESVDDAIKMIDTTGCNSVVGVREEAFYEWKDGKPVYMEEDGHIPNSVDLQKTTYETTGLYIIRISNLLKTKIRTDPNSCKPYYLSKLESIDINTEEDMEFARQLWKTLRKDRKSYGFDIDGTITVFDTKGDYEESIPNYNMIEKINKLYDEGHYITITTSRGHSRGTRKILMELAEKQLERWGVKYHRLLEKPYYDLLVDDATATPEEFINDR